MKSFFAKKIVTAVLFIIMLFSLSFLNLKTAGPALKEDLTNFLKGSANQTSLSKFAASLDSTAEDKVYGKYAYIEAYGYIQKLLDKNEINNFEVVKDKNGYLYYTYFTTGPNNVDTLVERMERMKEAASKCGSKVMYVMTPDKYIEGKTQFEQGIPYNYANETADNFLNGLKNHNIDTLDFRQLMKEDGKYTLDSFYKTDHHWKVQTAFWAFTKFVDVLENKYGLQFPHKALYTDLNNYNQVVYKDSYIGSMGRKEGKLYSGTEDFTFIYPKFDTNYYFYAQDGADSIKTQGRFEQSITFTSMLSGKGDIYDANNDKFFTYMNGNPGFAEVTNFNEPKGAKVLFIKDSLMVPVASFFSLGCSKVYMIDPRYYSGNIADVISKYKFDYIFVSFSPQNLTEQFFPFYKNGSD